MATETQIEISRDPTGLVTRTVTTQAFEWIDPSEDCRSYRVAQADGVVTRVEEFFDVNPAVYALDVATTQEPIESHPHFATMPLADKENWARWKQNPVNPELNGWDPSQSTDPLMAALYAYWQKGITNYFAPRIVVKCTTLDTTAPDADLVGKISATGYPGNTGDVNFLLTGISSQQEGTNFRVTREYLGSAVGTTWDATLYS